MRKRWQEEKGREGWSILGRSGGCAGLVRGALHLQKNKDGGGRTRDFTGGVATWLAKSGSGRS